MYILFVLVSFASSASCVHLSWHDCINVPRHVYEYICLHVHVYVIFPQQLKIRSTPHWFGNLEFWHKLWEQKISQNGHHFNFVTPVVAGFSLWSFCAQKSCQRSVVENNCKPFYTHVGMLVVLLLYHDTTRSSYVFFRFSILSFSLFIRLHVSKVALRESDFKSSKSA